MLTFNLIKVTILTKGPNSDLGWVKKCLFQAQYQNSPLLTQQILTEHTLLLSKHYARARVSSGE